MKKIFPTNFKIQIIVITVIIFITFVKALKCRMDEGPSDEELRKTIHKCMKRIGTDNQDNNTNRNNNYDGNGNGGYWQNNNNNNNNNNKNNWDYDSNDDDNDDFDRLKNREHLQMRSYGRNKRSPNNDRNRQQQNDRRYGNGNDNNRNGNANNNDGNSNNNNNNNNNWNNHHNQRNNSDVDRQDKLNQHDKACIVHCFFREMNMINNDDYPDKRKVLQILTKDIKNHDLREFYTDSIGECFHFLEMEQRKDKCEFSKALINCMTEYAKANCEDWDEHTIIFN